MFFGIGLVLGAWSWDATSNASYPFWGHLSVSNPMMFLSSTPLCPSLCLTWGNFFILLKFLLDNLPLAFLLNLHDSFSRLLATYLNKVSSCLLDIGPGTFVLLKWIPQWRWRLCSMTPRHVQSTSSSVSSDPYFGPFYPPNVLQLFLTTVIAELLIIDAILIPLRVDYNSLEVFLSNEISHLSVKDVVHLENSKLFISVIYGVNGQISYWEINTTAVHVLPILIARTTHLKCEQVNRSLRSSLKSRWLMAISGLLFPKWYLFFIFLRTMENGLRNRTEQQRRIDLPEKYLSSRTLTQDVCCKQIIRSSSRACWFPRHLWTFLLSQIFGGI